MAERTRTETLPSRPNTSLLLQPWDLQLLGNLCLLTKKPLVGLGNLIPIAFGNKTWEYTFEPPWDLKTPLETHQHSFQHPETLSW